MIQTATKISGFLVISLTLFVGVSSVSASYELVTSNGSGSNNNITVTKQNQKVVTQQTQATIEHNITSTNKNSGDFAVQTGPTASKTFLQNIHNSPAGNPALF